MSTHFCIAAPSSSLSSRLRACSGVSPDSTFPPGNSHFSGELSFRRRCPISSRRSLRSITAATTVLMAGGALETCWLRHLSVLEANSASLSSSFATFLSLENLPKLLCTLHQWRPRRVQQLVADHMDAAILNRRHLLPGADFVSLLRIRAISRRRPRQHHHVRPCFGHLLLIHMLAWGNNHLSATETHEFRHPGRGTDARIRPGFTINTQPWLVLLWLTLDCRKLPLQFSRECFRRFCVANDSAEQSNVGVHIRERSRIHCQKIQRLFDEFANGFLLVRSRANHERGLEAQNFVERPHLPAIAQFRQVGHRCYVGAPLGHPYKRFFFAHRAQNRGCARSKRNDPVAVRCFFFHAPPRE